MSTSAIVFSGIAPHPPIMVPEVGGAAIAQVRSSIDAMAELTRRLIASEAETVVLVTPHAPLDAVAFVAYDSPKLFGDFANFRAPGTSLEFPLDNELLSAISEIAEQKNYEVLSLRSAPLDHGSAVPLYFLHRYGWNGRAVVLGYSFLADEDHLRLGACIHSAIEQVGRPVAFIASGDLSHRLQPDAPAGFSPLAHRFDDEVVGAIRENNAARIAAIAHDVRRTAGECGYRSMLVALGVTENLPPDNEVLSYEAPFGVGYLVAQLTNAKGDREPITITEPDPAHEIPALARQAVEHFVRSGEPIKAPAKTSALLETPAACFVTLKTSRGELRGCIGTIEPAQPSLAQEIIANAMSAAARDPRFEPVTIDELEGLRYSVDVLRPPEPATVADLDPAIYGVIVEAESGFRRGLLLPAIEGVDTVETQLEIAMRKAGIRATEPVKLSRFRVDRFGEKK